MAAANWANRTVFTGDNLDVLRGMDSETVDLIYADPSFGSNKHYAALSVARRRAPRSRILGHSATSTMRGCPSSGINILGRTL